MSRIAPVVLISSALLVAACGSPEESAEQATTSTTAVVATTATTAPSSTTEETQQPTTTATIVEPLTAEPIQTLAMRQGLFLDSSVMGNTLVMFGADAKGGGGVFWAADQPFETAVNIFDLADPNLDPGSIHEMVFYDGRYYAFPIWAEAEDELSPTMYVSSDGSTWEKTNFGSITKQASLRFTPDQPSAAGGAGVATAIVANGQIEATGWVTENGATVPVLWVGDGTEWAQSYLPAAEGASQGGYLASSKLGRVASLEGPTYFGFGTFVQPLGRDWLRIEPTVDDDGADAFTRFVGASDSAFYHLEYTHMNDRMFSTSADGVNWTTLDLPELSDSVPGIHVSSDDRLVAWDQSFLAVEGSTAEIWSRTGDGWVSTTYDGTAVLLVDDDHIVTADEDQIYIYER